MTSSELYSQFWKRKENDVKYIKGLLLTQHIFYAKMFLLFKLCARNSLPLKSTSYGKGIQF